MPTPTPHQSLTLARVVALILWILLANWWAIEHLGAGLPKIFELGGGTALIASLVPHLKAVLSKREQEQANGKLHAWGRGVLSWRLIMGLYAVGLLVVPFVSSLRVEPASSDAESVTLTYANRPTIRDVRTIEKGKETRFIVLTTPFGRNVTVAAEGFESTPFTVYPVTGVTVALGRDLAVAQSILFRPEHKGLVALKNRGTFQVFVVNTTGAPVLVAETTGVRSSLVVGATGRVPDPLVASWATDLPCDTGAERDRILDAWKHPVVLSVPGTAAPKAGAKFAIEIHAHNGDLVARTELQLGGDPLTDVLVRDVSPACE